MTATSRSLLIPMKDEATRLGATMATLAASAIDTSDTELVLIDDGSTDGSADVAEALLRHHGFVGRVLRLPRNVGKGGALQAGVAVATGETVAFVDADLSTPPEAIETAFELVEAGKADVVTTTRVHPDAVITALPPLARRYSGKSFNILTRRLGLTTFNDTQCGLKAFTAAAARTLFADLRVRRFAFDVEVLARAERSGLTVLELPVQWRHVEASRVRPIRDGGRMALDVVWIRWALRRWTPAPSSPSGTAQAESVPTVGAGAMDGRRFAALTEVERDNWWFAAKRRLVARAVAAHLPVPGGPAADVGWGTRAMVNDLVGAGFAPVMSTDASDTAVELARMRVGRDRRGAEHLVTVAEALPFRSGSLRCLTSLDVVARLDDDLATFCEYRRVLAPQGVVVLTVPAYWWAWSEDDVVLGHRRRYTSTGLRQAVERAGLRVERVSLHGWLGLVALLVRRTRLGRLRGNRAPEQASNRLPMDNRLLGHRCDVEGAVVHRQGLPAGLSILLVARHGR